MTEMTLRQRLEAIHRATQHQDPREIENIREHAYYALAILDASTKRHGKGNYTWLRLVPDPEPSA